LRTQNGEAPGDSIQPSSDWTPPRPAQRQLRCDMTAPARRGACAAARSRPVARLVRFNPRRVDGRARSNWPSPEPNLEAGRLSSSPGYSIRILMEMIIRTSIGCSEKPPCCGPSSQHLVAHHAPCQIARELNQMSRPAVEAARSWLIRKETVAASQKGSLHLGSLEGSGRREEIKQRWL